MPSNLKNLIRERIKKTGESWSTAARHVRAQGASDGRSPPSAKSSHDRQVVAESGRAHRGAQDTEPLTLGQVQEAVHALFARGFDGDTFTARINSLRLPESSRPDLVAELELIAVTFERHEQAWVLRCPLAIIDGEVYDGMEKLSFAWHATDAGKDRIHRALREEVQRNYSSLASLLTDLRIRGGTNYGNNIVFDVNMTVSTPLYALLSKLRAPTTFSVLTGRLPAVGVSASLQAAIDQANRLGSNPQWYAETGAVQMLVSHTDHDLLLSNGAAHDRKVQMIRSHATEQVTTFAAKCDNCRRWVSLGTVERKGTCVCGKHYRITFDLVPVRHRSRHRGPCCMDCGKEMAIHGSSGSLRPWHVVNEGQSRCSECNDPDAAVKATAQRLGNVQRRVLRTNPTVGEPEKTELADLEELDDADRRHRHAVARKFGFPTS